MCAHHCCCGCCVSLTCDRRSLLLAPRQWTPVAIILPQWRLGPLFLLSAASRLVAEYTLFDQSPSADFQGSKLCNAPTPPP
jgi:hypothetical protein